jgi:GNAT superfamily N-acetyltransferase
MTNDGPEPGLTVAGADPDLDARLSEELTAFNLRASGAADPREITARVDDEAGLVAGLSGWSWGGAAGIELLWVREDARSAGWGSRLLAAAEQEARARGCAAITVSSFTFQAPEFYRGHGYVETTRGARPSVRRPRRRVVQQGAPLTRVGSEAWTAGADERCRGQSSARSASASNSTSYRPVGTGVAPVISTWTVSAAAMSRAEPLPLQTTSSPSRNRTVKVAARAGPAVFSKNPT